MHVLQNIFRVFCESVNPLVGYNIGDEGKTMTALLGQVGAYDTSVETWEQYAERLGHFFDANNNSGIEETFRSTGRHRTKHVHPPVQPSEPREARR